MTGLEDYLASVRRSMRGMDPRVREDILRELRSHVAEATAANGGDVGRALAAMGSPGEVGRSYRALYGYGRAIQAGFIALAALFAVFSVPVLTAGDLNAFPSILSVPILVVLVGWLLWVSAAAGSRVGLLAGIVACVVRLGAAGLASALQGGAVVLFGGALFFGASSALLILLGWLPGTARKAWGRPPSGL